MFPPSRPRPLVAELHPHKAAQLGEQVLDAAEWRDEDPVFAQLNGRPISKGTDYDDWTRLVGHRRRSARVAARRRPTAGTVLLNENVHPRD